MNELKEMDEAGVDAAVICSMASGRAPRARRSENAVYVAYPLVNRVVPGPLLRQTTLETAATIAANAPFSVASLCSPP